MKTNEIHALSLSKTRSGSCSRSQTHNLLKQPSFSELNQFIANYPQSPKPSPKPPKLQQRPSSCSRYQQKPDPRPIPDDKECTFHPKISSFSRSLTQSIPLSQRLEKLSYSKQESKVLQEKAKRKQELEELAAFSFVPKILKYETKGRVGILDRLEVEKDRISEREKIKWLNEVERTDCPFRPKIGKGSDKERTPLHERAEIIRVEKLKRLGRIQSEREGKFSYRPEINEKSRAISSSRRVKTCADSAEMRTTENFEDLPQLKAKLKPYDASNFLARQSDFTSKLKAKRETLIKSNSCKFSPCINKTSEIIVKSTNSPKSLLKKMHRLSNGNLSKFTKQKQNQDLYYSQFNYCPSINKASESLGRTSSIKLLADTTYKKKNIAKKIEAIRESDIKSTFTPDLNTKKRFNNLTSVYGKVDTIMMRIDEENAKKNAKLKDALRVQEFEQIRNCSFKPKLNEWIGVGGDLKEVKGIDRYFELKELGKRLQSSGGFREVVLKTVYN